MDEDRFLYYENEDGSKNDAPVHEEVMDDPAAGQYFALTLIQEYVQKGTPLEEAVDSFGDATIKEAFADGRLTPKVIDEVLLEANRLGDEEWEAEMAAEED